MINVIVKQNLDIGFIYTIYKSNEIFLHNIIQIPLFWKESVNCL